MELLRRLRARDTGADDVMSLDRYGLLGKKSLMFADSLGASNNWVVGGKHTSTGKPILANDPHLGLTAPGVWMLMHLECPTYNAIGSVFAGVPFVVIGSNQDVPPRLERLRFHAAVYCVPFCWPEIAVRFTSTALLIGWLESRWHGV